MTADLLLTVLVLAIWVRYSAGSTGSGPSPSADRADGHSAVLSSGSNEPTNVIWLDPQRFLTEQRHPPRGGADLRIDGAANHGPRRNSDDDVWQLRIHFIFKPPGQPARLNGWFGSVGKPSRPRRSLAEARV
jgi:hypothetical protein